jgi:hypothetical protein
VTSMARMAEFAAVGTFRLTAISAGRRRGCCGSKLVGSRRTSNLLRTRPDRGARVKRSVYIVFRMALWSGVFENLQENRWSPNWSHWREQ